MVNISTLRRGIDELDIKLDENQLKEFSRFKELLEEWNEKINITSIREEAEVDIKHFLDSLTPVATNLFEGKKKVIDIGTGGGFPGIPLKIYNKELEITLMDSLNKRIKFLDEVIGDLKLENIEAIHGRAEELGRTPEYREIYDICISRAVASLDTLAEYCIPFVKVGGYFISMKGPEVEEELALSKKAIKTLGGEIVETQYFTLPESDIVHSLIIIKKVNETANKYPRAGGKPRSKPL